MSVFINSAYENIWKRDDDLAFDELENPQEHNLCYVALRFASKYETIQAQDVLKKIAEKMPEHSCSIVSEATSLVYFSLREFTAAKDFAMESLKKNPASLFAYQILARIAIYENKYSDAIQYYQNILEHDPVSDKTMLNMAETYYLRKEFDYAIRYAAMAHSSVRKKLYLFLLSFSSWKTRLLWMLLVVISFFSPYLFFFLFAITTVFLVYVAFQFGYRKGDLLVFRRSAYIQVIHSILFAIAFCATVSYLWSK